MVRYLSIFIPIISTIFFTACVSDSSERVSGEVSKSISISGISVDGPIQNADICLDINFNGKCDSTDPSSDTNSTGAFELSIDYRTNDVYRVISKGGTDTTSGQFFDATLECLVDIKINEDTPTIVISPLTTLASKIYDDRKLKDATFTKDMAEEVLSKAIGVQKEQITKNPMDDIEVFAHSQKLIQLTKLLVIDIVDDITDRELNQETFDKLYSQLALSLSSDINISDVNATYSGKVDASGFIQDIEVFDPDIVFSDSVKTFAPSYMDEVESKVRELNSTEQLAPIQNVLSSYVYQVDKVVNEPQNVTATLDDILSDVQASDGNTMVENYLSIIEDNIRTLKPTIELHSDSDSGVSNSDNITNDTTPTLIGQAEAESQISIRDDSNNTIATTTADSDGAYSVTLDTLSDATYNLNAVAKDEFGHTNTSDSLTLVIDTVIDSTLAIDLSSESDSGSSSADNITNDTTPTIITDQESALEILDSDSNITQSVNTSSDGSSYSVDLSELSDGTYTVRDGSLDFAESTNGSLEIVIDSTPPTFGFQSDGDTLLTERNISINDDTTSIEVPTATDEHDIVYSLSGEHASYLSIDSSAGAVEIINSSITNSALSFSVDATDVAGNISSINYNVTIQKLSNIATDKFSSADTSADEFFGRSIAMHGDYIVVGASGAESSSTVAGKVYLYKKTSDNRVVELSQIKPTDSAVGDEFGYTVAINSNYIVVGSPQNTTNGTDSGMVYLFKINNDSVTQVAKFSASDTNSYDLFGSSVSIDGAYIAVGAKHKEKDGSNNVGAAYLFNINDNSVSEVAKFLASDVELNDYFGTSISISDDYILVGSNGEDTGGVSAGAAYLFKKDSSGNVSQSAKLMASDASDNAEFGKSVSISGSTMVVGIDSGAAYVFAKDSSDIVSELGKTTPTVEASSGKYGSSVSIDSDLIAISAYNETGATGSVYLYMKADDGTISSIGTLQAPDSRENEYFGASVSVYGGYVVVGSTRGGLKDGSAYLFTIYEDQPYMPVLESTINLYESDVLNQHRLYPTSKDASVSYAISGDDSAYFVIEDNILKGVDFLDYENPVDVGKNNTYALTIDVIDSDNRINSYDTSVVINDLDYLNKAKLLASDPEAGAGFGSSVAVDGDYMVIGAKDDEGAGSAYLYKKEIDGSVTELVKFSADDVASGDMFGSCVAISGDYMVVGSSQKSSSAGAAYLFRRASDTNVTQVSALEVSDLSAGDMYGGSISIDGDYIVLGAKGNDDSGSAYVFKRFSDSNVSQIAKINSSDGEDNDKFGSSVAIDGDYIAIGASAEDAKGVDSGAVYVFKRYSDSNVSELKKLTATDGASGDSFGSSVSISGLHIAIGASANDGRGSAYLFRRANDTSITEISKFSASDAKDNDMFGSSISIDGNNIVVGAVSKDEFGNDSGSAYIFGIGTNLSVSQTSKLIASDISDYSYLGGSVDISGDNIIVGADEYKSDSTKSGSAYMFVPDSN